jgi:hypothetical protein
MHQRSVGAAYATKRSHRSKDKRPASSLEQPTDEGASQHWKDWMNKPGLPQQSMALSAVPIGQLGVYR